MRSETELGEEVEFWDGSLDHIGDNIEPDLWFELLDSTEISLRSTVAAGRAALLGDLYEA